MKKLLVLIFTMFTCIVRAETFTMNWYADGNTYTTTTCQIGNDIILPATPTKYGYDFIGWRTGATLYTPVEYIESTGTQYIDTGIKFTGQQSVIETSFAMTKSYKDSWVSLSATQAQTPVNRWGGIQIYDKNMCCTAGDKMASNGVCYNIVSGIRYDIKLTTDVTNGTNTLEVNGTTNSITISSECYTNKNLLLFAKNTNGTVSEYFYGRLYSYNISIDNVLVRDFIPVLDEEGVPCMYDRVSETFFYNAGTGSFIAGPVVSGE